jgi:GntR family transcriptional regulator, rspAB operon transcriptional repressor
MIARLSSIHLDRSRPLRDQIYPVMRTLILSGAIGPGESIDEKAIAAQLKVSRTPVREAVQRLSDEQLVDVVAQSGTRASAIDRHEIEQAFLIRRALEAESAAQAATRISDANIEKLEDILVRHGRALARKKYVEAIERDDDFHSYIAAISNLTRLWRTVEISKAQLDRCRHMMVPRAGEGEATLQHHRAIIKALKSGDPEKARKAMREHLEAAYRSTIAVLDGPGLVKATS